MVLVAAGAENRPKDNALEELIQKIQFLPHLVSPVVFVQVEAQIQSPPEETVETFKDFEFRWLST